MKKLLVQVGASIFASASWDKKQFPAVNGQQNEGGEDEMWEPYHNWVEEKSTWDERKKGLGSCFLDRMQHRMQGCRETESSMTKSHSVSSGTSAENMFPLEAENAERWAAILREDKALNTTFFPEEMAVLSILAKDAHDLTDALTEYSEIVFLVAGGEYSPLWAAAHHLGAYIKKLAPDWMGEMKYMTIEGITAGPGGVRSYFKNLWKQVEPLVGYKPADEGDFLATDWPTVASLQAAWRTGGASKMKSIFKIQEPLPEQCQGLSLWKFGPEYTELDGQHL